VAVDERVLDDVEAVEAGDPSGMLAKAGSAGAQFRLGVLSAAQAGVASLAAAGRPRALLVAGMGGSAAAGDVLCGLAGPEGPVPVVLHRGYGLPGWVGPADLVLGVSASGTTEETLSAVAEAGRRGTRLLTVGAPASPLAELCAAGHGLHVPVDTTGWQPRACIWALSVPLLAAAQALRIAPVPMPALDATADLLDLVAERCRPGVDAMTNPAKALALRLAGGLPMIWGSSPLAGVAARRFACQLNENAKVPAVSGELPEVGHNQIVALDGPYGAAVDRTDLRPAELGPSAARQIRLVILRDTGEHPQLARRRAVSVELAESCGVAVGEIPAEGTHPLERLASLIAITDHASVYLALLLGIDPTPIWPISHLKERLARSDVPASRERP
jgi:glucose/mannose-6-phosphate isomerase